MSAPGPSAAHVSYLITPSEVDVATIDTLFTWGNCGMESALPSPVSQLTSGRAESEPGPLPLML